jgi:exonuclease SbcC
VIPVRLEVQGFLSYRDRTVLDLDDISAGAILGENGAGKTSLIEAMGWALYGRGRGRGPDDFVNAGADACRVVFDFTMPGGTYRVERQRSMAGRGKSFLGLYVDIGDHRIATGVRPAWEPIGGDRIEETEAVIRDLLGMDHATWTTTSWIGQGEADRFTELRPAERKALLAEVLDLSRFEAWADVARTRAREIAGRLAAMESRRQELEGDLAREPEAQQAASDAAERAQRARDYVGRVRIGLENERASLMALREQAAAVEPLKRELAALADARTRASRAAFEASERAMREAQDLGKQEVLIVQELTALEAAAARVPGLEEQERNLRAAAEDHESRAADAETDAEQQREAHQDLTTRQQVAEQQLEPLRSRRQALTEGTTGRCPTCGAALAPEAQAALVSELSRDLVRLEEESKSLATGAAMARDCLVAAVRQAADHRARAREMATDAASVASRLAVDRASAERIPEVQRRLTECLRRRDEAAVEMSDKAALSRDADQPNDREKVIAAELLAAAGLQGELAGAEQAVHTRMLELQEAEETVRRTSDAAARAREALRRFDDVRQALAAVDEQSRSGVEMKARLELVAEGCGRNGVPALLIETAIPDLEDEANRLLSKLTLGQLSVRIESLRALKGGGMRETLDIQVADSESDRPLENLSGGERQCVDLSLRVALSRLLARRAGRQIQTLVIDEGFTELDPAHRQRSLELIAQLQEEFRVVLVVTHIAEIADAFPVRIVVTKGPAGSRIEREGAAA